MGNKLINHWATFVIKYRWMVMVGFLILIFGSIPFFKNLYFDNSSDKFFVKGDPTLTIYDDFRDKFGSTEYLGVAFETRAGDKNVFHPETLRAIAGLTEFFENHEYVTKVSSLTNYQFTLAQDDMLDVEDLIEDMEELDESQANMDRLAAIMEKEILVHGIIITPDMQHTSIVVRTLYQEKKGDHKVQLINDLNNYIQSNQLKEQGFNIHIFGSALLSERFSTVVTNDTKKIYPFVLLLIFIALLISFRNAFGVLLPWLIIFSTILLVVGTMGLFHWPFNTINTSLPLIIVMLGIGDSVHILMAFFAGRSDNLSPKEAAIKAIKEIWRPCFFTSLTTSMGFLALSVTELVPIKQYAFMGALGSMIAFFLSLTILPAILSFTNIKAQKSEKLIKRGWIAGFTTWLTPFVFRHKKIIQIGCLILFVTSFALSTQIKVDSNLTCFFKEDTPFMKDLTYFDNVFGGVQNIEMMVDSGIKGGVKDPEFLKIVDSFESFLSAQPEIGDQTRSIINYVKRLNKSMHNDDPNYFSIPETRQHVAQYLLLYENGDPNEDLTDLKTIDERYMRISLRVKNNTTKETSALVARIKSELVRNYPSLNIEFTGGLIIYIAQTMHLLDGLTASFSIAVLVIGACFVLIFRSFKYGLLGMVPSICPILFAGALMYLLDISLDMGTMIVAAMTMGIAVDDSIHIMNRFVEERRRGTARIDSIHRAVQESGRAIIFTTVTLAGGFSVMIGASFLPMVYMGLFSAVILTIALLTDLFFLPALILIKDNSKSVVSTSIKIKESVA